MNVPTTDTIGTAIFKEAMNREKKSLVNWEYKYGPLQGASMDPKAKPGRLFVELKRGRNFHPLDADGLADSYAVFRLGNQVKRSSTIKSLEPVWNETFQLDCTRGETLVVEVFDDDSIRKVKVPEYSELQGRAQVVVADLLPGEHQGRTLRLSGGPGKPVVQVSLMWRATETLSFSNHETQLRNSLSQMRQELNVARAQKASWENSSGYLRSFGVLAPKPARAGTLDGPAIAEVFADAKPLPEQPHRYGTVPLEDMVPKAEVVCAVANFRGQPEFQVVTQSAATGGVDMIVGPGRHAKSYLAFQDKWKAVDVEFQGRIKQRQTAYPTAPDGTELPCLYGGFKRRMNRYF